MENVDLASSNVGLQVVRVLLDSLRERSDGAEVVVDAPVCYRKYNEHGLAVVGTNLHQLFQIQDGLLRELLIKVGDCSVEQSIIVLLVGFETLGEHLTGVVVLLLGEKYLARLEELLAVQNLLLSDLVLLLLLDQVV